MNLFTKNGDGPLPSLVQPKNPDAEAQVFAYEVLRLRRHCPVLEYRDFAVLVRTGAMTRAIESAFTQHGIPYRMVGSMRFFDREEIRDW